MEFTLMDKQQASKLKPVLDFDLNYFDGLYLLPGEVGPVAPVVMNRISKRVLNPLILQAYLKSVTIKQIPVYMVSIPLELEIIAAIACNGGLDAFLCPYPTDTRQVINNFLQRTPEQLATIAPPEYIAELIEMSAGIQPQAKPAPVEPAPPAIPVKSNMYDIPVLSLPHLSAVLPFLPDFVTWGSRKRAGDCEAVHFYTDDKRFSVLESSPELIQETGAKTAIEVNYSLSDDMPAALVIASIWKKRTISRQWQKMGIEIIVDMNVSRKWLAWNLEGVPLGWKRFANRAYVNDLEHLNEAFNLACERAGTDDIDYYVYGRAEAKKLCEANNWHWIDSSKYTFGQ